MAFHDLLIDRCLYVERQWVSEDQVSNEMRKRHRPAQFTNAVKLQNIENVHYLNVFPSWEILETREAQSSSTSGFMAPF